MKREVSATDMDGLRAYATDLTRDSQAQFAREHGVSLQYLNDFLRGRRDAGKKLLQALGYEKVVVYKPCKS